MFSRLFLSSLHSISENVLSISSRTLWNVRMSISILSLVDQFWNTVIQFRALSPVSSIAIQIRRSQKPSTRQQNNFVYWHSFSSKFQSNSSPRCRSPITLDEFEWQNTEFVRRNDEFDPTFLTRLATQTNFSDNWRIWMLNFQIWLTKHECGCQFDETEL